MLPGAERPAIEHPAATGGRKYERHATAAAKKKENESRAAVTRDARLTRVRCAAAFCGARVVHSAIRRRQRRAQNLRARQRRRTLARRRTRRATSFIKMMTPKIRRPQQSVSVATHQTSYTACCVYARLARMQAVGNERQQRAARNVAHVAEREW